MRFAGSRAKASRCILFFGKPPRPARALEVVWEFAVVCCRDWAGFSLSLKRLNLRDADQSVRWTKSFLYTYPCHKSPHSLARLCDWSPGKSYQDLESRDRNGAHRLEPKPQTRDSKFGRLRPVRRSNASSSHQTESQRVNLNHRNFQHRSRTLAALHESAIY